MAKTDPKDILTLRAHSKETQEKDFADNVLRPEVNAGQTVKKFSGLGDSADLTTLVDSLSDQSKAVSRGDLTRAESILITQAQTLDAMFHHLAQRSMMNFGEYLGAADTYMKLALRAQNQCRATLQTLGELKNPQPVAFVKQANISNGPQQVNNGTAPPRASENQFPQNELLEQIPSEQLDVRASSAAGRIDPHLEAVGAIHGAEDTRG